MLKITSQNTNHKYIVNFINLIALVINISISYLLIDKILKKYKIKKWNIFWKFIYSSFDFFIKRERVCWFLFYFNWAKNAHDTLFGYSSCGTKIKFCLYNWIEVIKFAFFLNKKNQQIILSFFHICHFVILSNFEFRLNKFNLI